jgi:hypothetical protein
VRRRTFAFALLLTGLLSRAGYGFDSHCGVADEKCVDGLAAARTRWGVDEMGGEDQRAEHRTIWLRSRVVSGLPASFDDVIRLPVFTAAADLGGGRTTLRPVRMDPALAQTRVTTLAEMAQLPDFSYTLWDWATGNELCPPDSFNSDPLDCHDYKTHMGWLNSNHMLPLAERFYEHYHRLALLRAADCRALHDDVAGPRPELLSRYESYLLACEEEAMMLEAVGHHFLQDAWSMGHMWERWGGPEVSDWPEIPGAPGANRTLGGAIAALRASSTARTLERFTPQWRRTGQQPTQSRPSGSSGW